MSFGCHPLAVQIDEARHHNFMKLALPHLISGLFTAGLVYFLFQDMAKPYAPVLWLAANVVLLLCTVLFYSIYHKRHHWLSIKAWGQVTFLVAALWGICWSLPPFILLDSQQALYVGLLVAFMVAMASVPAPVMVNYPAAYVAFISFPLGSLWLKTLLSAVEGKEIIQLLTPFLWLTLLLYGWDLHKTIIESIRLRLEHKQALDEAEQANVAKSKFIAAASHDIRQPLQAATLFMNALKEHPEKQHSALMLSRLESSIDGMSELLNSLLDVSRLDAQVVEINPEHKRVTEVFNRLRDSHQDMAQDKGLTLEFATEELAVFCDAMLLERVLNNLISNAIRYTPQGHIWVNATGVADGICFSIKDTGLGIADSELESIFDEFYQLANPERDKQKGLGLGLSIVKRLCELQNWPLKVQSKLGEGSCFAITVPRGELQRIEAKAQPSLTSLHLVSALVIDDNQQVCLGLKQLLESWQCKVITAASTDLAIAELAVNDFSPNLVISDYRLAEGKNGLDGIQQIRDYLGVDVQSILITGDTAPDELELINQSDTLLLHKPVKPGKLRAVLQKKFNPLLVESGSAQTGQQTVTQLVS